MTPLLEDHSLSYQNNRLFMEEVDLTALTALGSPLYVYSTQALTKPFLAYQKALGPRHLVCYALKANSSLALIKTLASLGAGADVVSGGELTLALKAGIPPSKIVFSGVGKTEAEIRYALKQDILQLNVESLNELYLIARLADHPVRLALRLNPDIDALTHANISTGKSDSKFGLPHHQLPLAVTFIKSQPHLQLVGLSMHIGSQLLKLDPLEKAFFFLKEQMDYLTNEGFTLKTVDFGGGLGIRYFNEVPPSIDDYINRIKSVFNESDLTFICEPGRSIVGNAGILLTKVLFLKEAEKRTFAIVDAGMNDKMRYALYQSYHHILPLKEPITHDLQPLDIAGPVCESTDIFARDRPMPPLSEGDYLALLSSGAYSSSMSSTYNTRMKPAEIMVNGGNYAVTRRQQTIEDLLSYEAIPSWLEQQATSCTDLNS